MNKRVVVHILGWLLIFEGIFLLLPCIVGLFYREKEAYDFAITAVICLSSGFLVTRFKPKSNDLYAREGFVIVALSWIVLSLFGAIPLWTSDSINEYVEAVFEVASGFTTTGASIVENVELLPKCVNFWRTFTHWIGGMGVLVFMMAIVPLADSRNMYLMKAESPGPVVGKLVPKVKTTAKLLYRMYLVLSLFEFIFLLFGGLNVYEAMTTTFGTAGTGGFGIYADSVASFSTYTQIVITIFMILFGVNFSFYYALFLLRKPKEAFKMSEVRTYLSIILFSAIMIIINVRHLFPNLPETIKHVFFQVASIITTTGYSTVDFDTWPEFSKTILLMLMFVGACAGSTGGGMKVSRFIIWAKTFVKQIRIMIHPRNIQKVTVDGRRVEHDVIRSVNVYLVVYIIVFSTSLLIISLNGFDFTTNFSSVATTINNIGPGFNLTGPSKNFHLFSPLSKIVLIIDMIAGRLEVFPLLLLISPYTWKK